MTVRQKREMLRAMLPTILRYPGSRLRTAFGRRGDARLDLDAVRWPDSALAKDAEAEARERLTPWVLEHSYRTWLFGLLLAQLDGVEVDEELVFVASILHDLAIERRTPGRCFAVVGAEEAQRFAVEHGASVERAGAIGAACAGHLTPGAFDDLTDPAGFVSGGAFVDITGYGLDRFDPTWVDDLHSRHPRRHLKRELREVWKAESKTVPGGRPQTMTRYTGFRELLRIAPYSE